LTVSIIKKAKNHLTKKDSMQIPLISLSNVQKIVNVAEENFSGVKIVKSKDWFLPKEIEDLKGKMNELKSKNYINFDEKFGKIICKTSIAVCKKPKNIE
jgi:menaquinone-dependent protoporphyrinogen IX oxidase